MRFRAFGLDFFQRVFVITGCEASGDAGDKYMSRYRLIEKKDTENAPGFGLYLHIFHRSDRDVFHDHPFPFTSFVLWNGYIEEIPPFFPGDAADHFPVRNAARKTRKLPEVPETDSEGYVKAEQNECIRLDVRPLSVNYRPAAFIHRVKLRRDKRNREKPAITLIWRGPKIRNWGFWRGRVFIPFRKYFDENGC
jgi:hypothetical protein